MSADTNVTVTFSEAMNATTVNETTIELRDPSSALVPATVSYDAALFTATLDPTASLSPEVKYTARVRGGSADPRVKDVAGNALADDVTWSFTIAPAPPQVVSTTPASDAPDVPTGVAPRAKFSKPLDPMSVNAETVLLRKDGMPDSVPITISYASNPSTVALVPQAPLQPLQKYTVTLVGGANAPHITDTAGLPLAVDYTWSFTTAAPPPPITGLSIFAPNVIPDNPIQNDSTSLELGLKFRSASAGLITGVRFYKGGAANDGTHVGHLWIPNEMQPTEGTLLCSVTFTNETESGWQQALFQTPIPINANTTYVVSYLAPHGNYAADNQYFASSGVDSPPLHALSNAEAGGDSDPHDDGRGNGVFLETATGGFPISTFRSTNYYVDVVFVDPTLSAPQVLSTTPAPGAINVSTGVAPRVTFSEPIDPTSVNASTVLLTDTADNAVPFTISFGAGNFTVILTPLQPLQPGQAYTVTLKGGPDPHITDATGTPLAADYTWSFTTESPPPVTSTQVTMLGNWATAGVSFIALRPDKLLACLLGLNHASSVRSDAHLLVDTPPEPGAGIVNQTIQYHGAADRSNLAGATPLVAVFRAANGNALATFAP